jgi:hypothetical protein
MVKALAEQAKATDANIDFLLIQFATWMSWMKTMEASVADLNTTAATLRLHAEDIAARLGALASRTPPPAPRPPVDVTPLQATSAVA